MDELNEYIINSINKGMNALGDYYRHMTALEFGRLVQSDYNRFIEGIQDWNEALKSIVFDIDKARRQ